MMAGAKRELADAIEELQEPQAELVLSLVHYLRARPQPPLTLGDEDERDRAPLWDWVRALFVLRVLERSVPPDEIASILEELEPGTGPKWSSLSEPVLARDWDRPEEDAAWADL